MHLYFIVLKPRVNSSCGTDVRSVNGRGYHELMVQAQSPVRIFLDVDGVLNSYPVPEPRFRREKRKAVRAWNYELHYRPHIVQLMERFVRRRHAQLVWLSTWSHLCTEEIEPKLGFTGRYAVEPMPDSSFNYYADDPHTWWKAKAVERFLREHPDERAIWIDDDLVQPATLEHFTVLFGERLLMIAPEYSKGLTEAHFKQMRRFTPPAPTTPHRSTPAEVATSEMSADRAGPSGSAGPSGPAAVPPTETRLDPTGPEQNNPYSLTPRPRKLRL